MSTQPTAAATRAAEEFSRQLQQADPHNRCLGPDGRKLLAAIIDAHVPAVEARRIIAGLLLDPHESHANWNEHLQVADEARAFLASNEQCVLDDGPELAALKAQYDAVREASNPALPPERHEGRVSGDSGVTVPESTCDPSGSPTEASGEAREWRPIDSAPRDGTRILLLLVPNEVNMPSRSRVAVGFWKEFQWRDGNDTKVGEPWWDWSVEGNQGPMSLAADNWMPLPQAIAGDGKGGQG